MSGRFTGYGFADYFMEQKRHIKTFLDKIDKPIDLFFMLLDKYAKFYVTQKEA